MNGFTELAVTVGVTFGISLAIYIIISRIQLRGNFPFNSFRIPVPSPRTVDRFFLLLVSAYVVASALLHISRHLSFNSGFDLGLYDQLVWNTINGRLFENS